jgi:predicted ATPase/DNA-binding SARP family transcriptional activator
VEVTVLGPIAAVSGGDQVAVSANQRLFIALLAANAGHVVSADLLIESLWGDELPDRPQAALQNLVSRVRSRLADRDRSTLLTHAPGYCLTLDRASVDRIEFEQRVELARTSDNDAEAIETYDSALALWRGMPYVEFGDVPALRTDAVRLEEVRATSLEERLTRLVRIKPSQSIAELEALVDAAPYREQGHALLMEALHRTGRQRDALRAYSRYRTILVEELGLDPSPRMQSLERDILNGDLAGEPHNDTNARSTVAVTRRHHNLPRRRTSFVGRDSSRDSIALRLLEDQLVTLVGVGGAGKTTLAIEVARSVERQFDDGVWLVDLLALEDGNHIAEHTAATIGLPTLPRERPLSALVDHLRHRRLLLVLDNCEHVIAPAAELADELLTHGDDLRVLATSREPLRVAGETLWHVEPLDVPPDGASLRDVLASSSGRVFIDRVNAADPRLQLEERDSALIRSICHRLDGIPLALELAAARVPALGMHHVAERLTDRFALLATNRPTANAHHQTLRDAIAWSVDLLDDDERLLLARLSVFVGGFDLDAAEEVCSDDHLDRSSIAEMLATLVERSLVVAYRLDGVVRHRLLETIREFAAAELGERTNDVRLRHRDWAVRLAREIGEGFLVHTTFWYQRLRLEFPNLRSAFTWSMARRDLAEALDIAGSLRWAPFNTGHLYAEHRAWIQQVLAEAADVDIGHLIRARGLVAAGAVAGLEGRSAAAIDHLYEAVTMLEGAGASDEIIWCNMWLGAFAADTENFAEAVEYTHRGLMLARHIGSTTGIVYLANQHGENNIAAAAFLRRPAFLDDARSAFTLAASTSTSADIEEGLVRAENGLAVLDAPNDPSSSLAACTAALATWRRLGIGNRLIMSLVSAARVAILAGEHETSARLLAEAVDVISTVGWRQPVGRLLEAATVNAVHAGASTAAALLTGASATRFMTPRWHVDISSVLEAARAHSRGIDSTSWDSSVDRGRTMTDDDLFEIVRQLATDAR